MGVEMAGIDPELTGSLSKLDDKDGNDTDDSSVELLDVRSAPTSLKAAAPAPASTSTTTETSTAAGTARHFGNPQSRNAVSKHHHDNNDDDDDSDLEIIEVVEVRKSSGSLQRGPTIGIAVSPNRTGAKPRNNTNTTAEHPTAFALPPHPRSSSTAAAATTVTVSTTMLPRDNLVNSELPKQKNVDGTKHSTSTATDLPAMTGLKAPQETKEGNEKYPPEHRGVALPPVKSETSNEPKHEEEGRKRPASSRVFIDLCSSSSSDDDTKVVRQHQSRREPPPKVIAQGTAWDCAICLDDEDSSSDTEPSFTEGVTSNSSTDDEENKDGDRRLTSRANSESLKMPAAGFKEEEPAEGRRGNDHLDSDKKLPPAERNSPFQPLQKEEATKQQQPWGMSPPKSTTSSDETDEDYDSSDDERATLREKNLRRRQYQQDELLALLRQRLEQESLAANSKKTKPPRLPLQDAAVSTTQLPRAVPKPRDFSVNIPHQGRQVHFSQGHESNEKETSPTNDMSENRKASSHYESLVHGSCDKELTTHPNGTEQDPLDRSPCSQLARKFSGAENRDGRIFLGPSTHRSTTQHGLNSSISSSAEPVIHEEKSLAGKDTVANICAEKTYVPDMQHSGVSDALANKANKINGVGESFTEKVSSKRKTTLEHKATHARRRLRPRLDKPRRVRESDALSEGTTNVKRRATGPLPASMNFVDHLCELKQDPVTDTPVWLFTVYGVDDSYLYDFRVDVRPSTINDGGKGAFITYLRARQLKRECRLKNEREIKRRVPQLKIKTMETLEVKFGSNNATLSLTGENLHGNNNNIYWAETMIPLRAAYSPLKKHVTVNLVGQNLHYDTEDEPERIDMSRRIGFLSLFTEADYEDMPEKIFPATTGSINLGRYGPFRKQDRKTHNLFTVKGFVFSNCPNEWCYDVEEKLQGELQVIDITDDATGLPHDLARKNVPMYVNEVGHDPKLEQNVFVRETHERSAYYFINLCSDLKPGESVELLTDYQSVYEEVRERKGYGWKNLNEGLKSDKNLAALLQRNFNERKDMNDVIDFNAHDYEKGLMIVQVEDILEFLQEFWISQSAKAQAFLKKPSARTNLLWQQWIALRRIHWLRDLFFNYLRDLESSYVMKCSCFPFKSVVNYCLDILKSMEWKPCWLTQVLQLSPSLMDKSGERSVKAILLNEIVEEVCYLIRNELPKPFNQSVWCTIARDLTYTLCKSVAAVLWSSTNSIDDDAAQKAFQDSLICAASFAAKDVLDCCSTREYTKLLFDAGVSQNNRGRASCRQPRERQDESFVLNHTTNPKAMDAAVVKRIIYEDAAALAQVDAFVEETLCDPDEKFIMVNFHCCSQSIKVAKLGSYPVSQGTIGSLAVNDCWYRVWQVSYIVHVFAKKFMTKLPDDFLDRLSAAVRIDPVLCQYAVEQGVKDYSAPPRAPPKNKSVPKSQRKAKKPGVEKSDKPPVKKVKVDPMQPRRTFNGRPLAKEIWQGKPDDKLEHGWPDGWLKKTFQRQSGATKGSYDCYWYTPKRRYKLRSLVEVRRYMNFLEQNDNDEDMAWALLKGRNPANVA